MSSPALAVYIDIDHSLHPMVLDDRGLHKIFIHPLTDLALNSGGCLGKDIDIGKAMF